MKKFFTILLSAVLVFSLTFTAVAKSDSANSASGKSTEENQGKSSNTKKEFKSEMNDKRKDLQNQKIELNKEIEQLQADYDACIAAGDTAGAEEILAQIESAKVQMEAVKSEIKQTINERYMLVKTMYSEEELAQFDSAADLIVQMYEDAQALGAGCVTVNNNLIKFEAPPYIKGGKTIIPVRAITEALDAEVLWDPDTETVTITKDNTTVEMTIGETTVFVDGLEVEATAPEINCGRTYIPLRFLAEVFGFDVTWDSENEIIDIDAEEDADTEDVSADPETPDSGTTAD